MLSTSTLQGFTDEARKNQLLNDAQRRMQMRLDTMGEDVYFRHIDTVTPTAGVIHLKNDLTKDCIRPLVVARQDGTLWTEVPIIPATDAFGAYRNAGECWYHLHDILKTDYDIGTAASRKVLYHWRVPDMTINGDVCQLPSDTHEVLAYDAAYLGCYISREFEAAKFYEDEVNKRWALIERALKGDASTKRRRIKQTEFYGRGRRDAAAVRAFWTPQ